MGLLRDSSWTDRRDHCDQETRYSKVMFGSAIKRHHTMFLFSSCKVSSLQFVVSTLIFQMMRLIHHVFDGLKL